MVMTATIACDRIAARIPYASPIAPITGTPIAPVTNPNPRINPDANPARPAISCCAVTSIKGAVDAARNPSNAASGNAAGPVNWAKSSTTGIVPAVVAITTARRPNRSANDPHPTFPAAPANTTVVASGP